jgi:hypothetical protein
VKEAKGMVRQEEAAHFGACSVCGKRLFKDGIAKSLMLLE